MKKNKLINPLLSFFKAALFALAFLFLFGGQASFSLGQTVDSTPAPSSSAPAGKVYYLISLDWDSANNTLKLKEGTTPELSTTSLVKDEGSGSQFYSMLQNAQGKYAISKTTKSPKYFLGKWELPDGQKQGEIKVTIPFLATGAKLIIADAKTDKAALELDISKLSHPVAKKAVAAPIQNRLPASQTSNKSMILGWMIITVILLILGGGGYWLYRFYKKRKTAQALTSLQPPSASNKI